MRRVLLLFPVAMAFLALAQDVSAFAASPAWILGALTDAIIGFGTWGLPIYLGVLVWDRRKRRAG
jgi:hypothetical protein